MDEQTYLHWLLAVTTGAPVHGNYLPDPMDVGFDLT